MLAPSRRTRATRAGSSLGISLPDRCLIGEKLRRRRWKRKPYRAPRNHAPPERPARQAPQVLLVPVRRIEVQPATRTSLLTALIPAAPRKRHISTKEAKGGALAKVLGSTAWIGVPARRLLAAVADSVDPALLHVQPIKGNRSPRGEAGGRVRSNAGMSRSSRTPPQSTPRTGIRQVVPRLFKPFS